MAGVAAKSANRTLQADLNEQIGRLKVELEWLKKGYPIRLRPSAP
jgi:hypothetical protein